MDDANARLVRAAEWSPPLWLRRLHVVRQELVPSPRTGTPEARLWLAFELMSFGLQRLRQQAADRGCTLAELLHMYDRATARLRARA